MSRPPRIRVVEIPIGKRIRQRRLVVGLSLESVAKELGISTAQQQRYEKGLRTIDVPTLFATATILKCQAADLLDDNGSSIEGLSADAIKLARAVDSLRSVGLRHTLKGFVSKLAAYDRERAE